MIENVPGQRRGTGIVFSFGRFRLVGNGLVGFAGDLRSEDSKSERVPQRAVLSKNRILRVNIVLNNCGTQHFVVPVLRQCSVDQAGASKGNGTSQGNRIVVAVGSVFGGTQLGIGGSQ